jgi:NADPH:quinone reductase-like Zn-dependent oxidoreductase
MVGYAAVQVALSRGVRVIATAGPTFAAELEGFGAFVTSRGEGIAERVRELGGGDVDRVLDVARTSPGTLPELIALAGGDPKKVVTVSNHDEARRLGARVNIDELLVGGQFPDSGILNNYAKLAADGRFRLPVAQTYPLDQWREAMELSVSGNPRGKLVLLPGENV